MSFVGDSNFAKSTNFTFIQSADEELIKLGSPGDMSGYEGSSGFIIVTRTNAATKPFIGIDDVNWKSATNTWINPATRNEGLVGTVLIGYYIANNLQVIYTASMVNY